MLAFKVFRGGLKYNVLQYYISMGTYRCDLACHSYFF